MLARRVLACACFCPVFTSPRFLRRFGLGPRCCKPRKLKNKVMELSAPNSTGPICEVYEGRQAVGCGLEGSPAAWCYLFFTF